VAVLKCPLRVCLSKCHNLPHLNGRASFERRNKLD
jgi:hypothetical protein